MSEVKVFNKNDIVINVNGVPMKNHDIASSDISVRRNEPELKQEVGIAGGVQTVKTANLTGTITFTLFDGEDFHNVIQGLKATGAPFLMSISLGTKGIPMVCSNCHVSKTDRTAGNDNAMVEVEILANVVLGT